MFDERRHRIHLPKSARRVRSVFALSGVRWVLARLRTPRPPSWATVLRCGAMALFHRATTSPTKAELIADWAPTQAVGPSVADPIDVIGSYRFDDPDGRVGMETHLVTGRGSCADAGPAHVPG